MAKRLVPIKPVDGLGAVSAALILLLTLGTLAAVVTRAEGVSALRPADWAALRFTLWQAFLSASLSVLLAVPVARALARRQFFGRSALITLLGAPFILPVIVAVLGLLAVFGRSGILSTMLGWVGLPPVHIYGLHGVVLAHVFFNIPLATRLILQGWLAIPAERFRLAASLGFDNADIQRVLEWPMLRAVVPGIFMVIFLLCMTSFAVVLALGGGPKATTLELAIYQAFRFDFDLGKAALLAVIQFGLCAVVAVIAWRVATPAGMGAGLDRTVERWDTSNPVLRAQDFTVLVFATLFLLTPLVVIFLKGAGAVWTLPDVVWWSAFRSVLVALGSAALAISLSLSLALLAVKLGQKRTAGFVEGIGYLTIAASPLVVGTGLFIMIFPFARPSDLALPVTAVVNAAMSLPFALRALSPALRDIENDYGRLADSLGLSGWSRLRLLILPRMRRPLGFAAGLAAALSMGDLGVIALFADPESATLPLQMFRLMTAYRMGDAAGAALVLLALSLCLFWIFDRGGRVDTDT